MPYNSKYIKIEKLSFNLLKDYTITDFVVVDQINAALVSIRDLSKT